MAITNGYLTLIEFKDYKGGTGYFDTDTSDDEIINDLIEAASRLIDHMTGQFFYSDTGETRYYTAEFGDILFTDNFSSIVTLKTDEDQDGTYENTWNTGQSTGDFYMMPFNAVLDGVAYNRIEVSAEGELARIAQGTGGV